MKKNYDKVNSSLQKHCLFLYFEGVLVKDSLLFEL